MARPAGPEDHRRDAPVPARPPGPAGRHRPRGTQRACGGNGSPQAAEAISGPVAYRFDPQALFASESLGQALRQLEVYGRDGLPVLSDDGHQIQGWATSASVLRALSRKISGAHDEVAQAQAAADWDHDVTESPEQHPPAPLPGYQVIELAIADDSPAAGQKLKDVRWPPASTPVSVLRGRQLRAPHPDLTLTAGDRVSLLLPAPGGPPSQHPDRASRDHAASRSSSA